MNMPGFNARFSLYRTSECYRMGGMLQGAEALIGPAQQSPEFPDPECCSSILNCSQCCRNLGLESPQQLQACLSACSAPTRCGPCTCRCDANCNRACSRTCTKSKGLTTLFCIEENCTPVAPFPGPLAAA
jgi:hypothetical protein